MENGKSINNYEISVLKKIRSQFIWYGMIAMICIAAVFLFLYIFFGGNYLFGLIASIIVCSLILYFQWKKLYVLGNFFFFFALSVLIFIQSYITKSGAVLCILGLLLIAGSISRSFKFTTWLFFLYLIVIGIYLGLGVLHFQQEFVGGSPIALVNNVQVSIPILVLSYLLSYFISRILVTSLAELQAQNRQLRQTQEILILQARQLRQTQENLISQARIESIQLLAAGFSHDFNNMLMGLSGNIDLILDSPNLSKDIIDSLKDMQQIGFQARNLSNSLMTLAKQKSQIQPTLFNIGEIIENVVKFALSGRKSKGIVKFPPDLMGVYGDPVQISQVIQNLIINADQAMEQGGIIRINAENLTLKEQNPYHLFPGEYIQIRTIDQGPGIPEKYQSEMFKPFFTTKSSGRGLGLTLCYSIIQNHNGYISFNSKEGTGAEFFFIIPARSLPPPAENLPEEQMEQYHGLILILEDNRNVLLVLESFLHGFGLETIGMTESTTFLKKLEQLIKESQKIDLVILDLTLPGDIGGKEMATQIRTLLPNIYIIASSGYSQEYVEANFDMTQFNDFLHKPYSKRELQNILKRWAEKRGKI